MATNEIRFGDNDRLSARVAVMASADELILLSDVEGLYTADPGRHEGAERIDVVSEITPEIEAMAGGAGSLAGTGGMVSKLAAARIATRAGCSVIIAPGFEARPLARLAAGGALHALRCPRQSRRARKEDRGRALPPWGAADRRQRGAALRRGSSLLPAGVAAVEGAFERGDAVIVRDPDGHDIAKGLCAYDADDAFRICGHRTEQIEELLGYRGRDELIHRDDLVLL